MEVSAITQRFNQVAKQYDEQRRFFIPCFDDYYATSISFLASIKTDIHSVLDLGAGTGLLTHFLYQKYPKANYTLVDISEDMLEIAKSRFDGQANFSYLVSDYSQQFPDSNFDLISSALSIHHLEHDAKNELYTKAYEHLNTGGIFINIDQFNASSKGMNEHYNQFWYEQIQNSGIGEQEQKLWLQRRALDNETTIEKSIQQMRSAGFNQVECIYSYLKFGVIIAVK